MLVPALVAAALFAAGLTALGQFSVFNGGDEKKEGNDVLGWAVTLAAVLVATVIVWRVARGPVASGNGAAAGQRALILGIVAALSLPAFWLGVYAPLAMGAIVLGVTALMNGAAGGRKVMALAGILLAILATGVCVSANIFG